MNASRTAGLLGTLSAAALALAACWGSYGGTSTAAQTSAAQTSAASSSAAAATPAATGAVLRTAATSLGTVVVTSSGRTVYAFDEDTQNSGKSACNAGCIGLWPAVTAPSAGPTAAGVGGKLGTITRSDGTKQLTLDGRPLYTYAGDSGAGAGAVSGQGVKGIWWAVTPSGAEITEPPVSTGY